MLLSSLFIILGLVFGSFIAAYSFRIIRGIPIGKGLSFCDKCGKGLAWYQNIPVFSYIFLKGRCAYCRKKISIRYPVIETVTALGFLTLYIFRSATPYPYFFSVPIFCILVLIFVTDIEHKIIPDEFTFFGILLSVFYLIIFSPNLLIPNLFYGFTSAAFLLSLHLATRGRGMGLGDVKFAVLGGLLMGGRLYIIWLFLAFLTGAIAAIILVLTKGAKLKDQIAFGPFLVIGIPGALVFGGYLLRFVGL